MLLVLPIRRRVARYGDRGEAVIFCNPCNGGSQTFQIISRVGDRGANTCSDFDLTLQKLRADLSLQFCRAIFHQPVWRFGESVTVFVNE